MNFTTHCDATGQKMYIVAGQDGHSQLYFISKKFEIVRSLSYSDNNDKGKNTQQKKCIINTPSCMLKF